MMSVSVCPCGSGNLLDACCGHYHAGTPAPDAQALMRSRYSAYVLGLVDYLVATTLPAQQADLDKAAMAAWSARAPGWGWRWKAPKCWAASRSTGLSPSPHAGTTRMAITSTVNVRRSYSMPGAGTSSTYGRAEGRA